jgi:hypothetical protein
MTGNHAFCARTVPKPPGDAPISATGRPRNTRGTSAGGREIQSTAFFSTPGIEWLYSGVTISSPSAASNNFFIAVTSAGKSSRSRSPL